MKLISFLRAEKGEQRVAFQDWMQHTQAPVLGAQLGLPRGLILTRLVDPPPDHPRRDYEDKDDGRPYDIVLEAWTDDGDAFAAALRSATGERADRIHSYRVAETTIVDRIPAAQQGVTPGIKYVGRLLFHPDLPASAMQRSWTVHGELAPRMFVDMQKYVQNFVEAKLSEDAPPANAIPMLFFPSFAGSTNLVEGGRERIMHDLKHFLSSGIRLYGHEHRIGSG